jgi:hypothetical protein
MLTIKREHIKKEALQRFRICKVSNGVFVEAETLIEKEKNLWMLCPHTGRECTVRCAQIFETMARLEVDDLDPEFKHLYIETTDDDMYEYIPSPYKIEGAIILNLCRSIVLVLQDVEMPMPIL